MTDIPSYIPSYILEPVASRQETPFVSIILDNEADATCIAASKAYAGTGLLSVEFLRKGRSVRPELPVHAVVVGYHGKAHRLDKPDEPPRPITILIELSTSGDRAFVAYEDTDEIRVLPGAHANPDSYVIHDLDVVHEFLFTDHPVMEW